MRFMRCLHFACGVSRRGDAAPELPVFARVPLAFARSPPQVAPAFVMSAPRAMTLRKKAGRQRESGPMGEHPGPCGYRGKGASGQGRAGRQGLRFSHKSGRRARVRASACARRHLAISAWLPDCRTGAGCIAGVPEGRRRSFPPRSRRRCRGRRGSGGQWRRGWPARRSRPRSGQSRRG